MNITSRLFITTGICFVMMACDNGPKTIDTDMINIPDTTSLANEDLPVIEFDEVLFDFGTIAEGQFVSHSFAFENTGDTPLVLTSVSSECGCTVMKNWPREPIAPGNEGTIEVEFNSTDRDGQQNKKITVVANTYPAKTQLTLKGIVVGPQNK